MTSDDCSSPLHARPAAARTIAALLCAMLACAGLAARTARAGEDKRPGRARAVKLLATIPVPGLNLFDIAVIDPDSELYFLADRSSNAIDVIDARRNRFVRRILEGGFRGATDDSDTSGPNGVAVSGHLLFAADAPSRVVAIDLRSDRVVGEVRTGGAGANRSDELAFDPDDGVLLVVNNADDPPFATLIGVDSRTGALQLRQRVSFQRFGPRGESATSGLEQAVYDRRLGKFLLAVPELDGPGGSGPHGAVVVIDPRSGRIERTFPVDLCQPSGLALGPDQDLLLGCSVIFDTAGVACEEPSAEQAIDCHGRSARPTQIILDARTGRVEREIIGVGGSDEVTFDPGEQRYFTASRDNPLGPVLGVIDARNRVLDQIVPTFNTPLTAPGPQGSAKSVAVDPRNGHALVALPAGNAVPNCLQGCVAVYGPADD
jgi:hypothetical protein